MLLSKFNEDCKKILAFSSIEAQVMGHTAISSIHIFLGFCKSESPDIIEVFKKFNIDPLIRREIRKMFGTEKKQTSLDIEQIGFSERVFEVLKSSYEIAKQNNTDIILPLHLLLALFTSGEGGAIRYLKSKGNNIEEIIEYMRKKIKDIPRIHETNSSQNTSTILSKIGRDLTELAKNGGISPVIGRSKEIKKLSQILTLKKKNNPILIGEAGVGKTAVVEGFVLKTISNDAPDELKNLRVIEISLVALIAGTKYRGEFEENILKMIEEAKSDPNIILFIDEIHTMVGAGGAGGSMDASNILKPMLARGEIKCIGATTFDEYTKYIESDSALERRFHPVVIDEPSRDDTINILKEVKKSYENHHNIIITDDAITSTVDYTIKYLPDRRLPDKALDIIDQASSMKKLSSLSITKEDLINGILQVTTEDIIKVISEISGIPLYKLTQKETEKILEIDKFLNKRVMGQDNAVKEVSNTIKISKSGLRKTNKPIGIFLFVGPTGVGKTELAKALAEFLFDNPSKIIRLDMSEFMEQHSVSKLIGAPPGYVGYDKGGQLTGEVRKNPYSVVLLDEMEKAHPSIYNIFLQVFDEGRLSDSNGRVIDFTNTIIIMTSNFNVKIDKKNSIGFAKDEFKTTEIKTVNEDLLKSALNNAFSPEFINRIDKIISFTPLGFNALKEIINKFINQLKKILKEKELDIQCEESVYEWIINRSNCNTYGARDISRNIEKFITEPLAEQLLSDHFTKKDILLITIESDKIIFTKNEDIKTDLL